jgi:DNA-binding HxlR family transcriptional regulator
MNSSSAITNKCPIRTTLDLVGGKWRLLLLFELRNGPLRPSELKRRIPDISEKMLIQELKTLTDNFLVRRTNYGEVPPRIDYRLTKNGKNALPLLGAFSTFASNYKHTSE